MNITEYCEIYAESRMGYKIIVIHIQEKKYNATIDIEFLCFVFHKKIKWCFLQKLLEPILTKEGQQISEHVHVST